MLAGEWNLQCPAGRCSLPPPRECTASQQHSGAGRNAATCAIPPMLPTNYLPKLSDAFTAARLLLRRMIVHVAVLRADQFEVLANHLPLPERNRLALQHGLGLFAGLLVLFLIAASGQL